MLLILEKLSTLNEGKKLKLKPSNVCSLDDGFSFASSLTSSRMTALESPIADNYFHTKNVRFVNSRTLFPMNKRLE